jgi:DNA-binding response OmpR family regulator
MADILMLEPDALLADTYRQAFELFGHTVRRTVSAQDGVFKVDEARPDLILVELQLVAHSGIEFLYELRSYSEWQDIPVLIHSCIPPTEFEGSAGLLRDLLGVRGYLYKPHTTLAKLLREVRAIVEAGVVEDGEVVQGRVGSVPAVSVAASAHELSPNVARSGGLHTNAV